MDGRPSSLNVVFEKLCFRDGLVWTEGLIEERKVRYQISLAYCRRGLSILHLVYRYRLTFIFSGRFLRFRKFWIFSRSHVSDGITSFFQLHEILAFNFKL